jgi:hypothetical protein
VQRSGGQHVGQPGAVAASTAGVDRVRPDTAGDGSCAARSLAPTARPTQSLSSPPPPSGCAGGRGTRGCSRGLYRFDESLLIRALRMADTRAQPPLAPLPVTLTMRGDRGAMPAVYASHPYHRRPEARAAECIRPPPTDLSPHHRDQIALARRWRRDTATRDEITSSARASVFVDAVRASPGAPRGNPGRYPVESTLTVDRRLRHAATCAAELR